MFPVLHRPIRALRLAALLAAFVGQNLSACSPVTVAVGAGAAVGVAAAQEKGVSAAADDVRIRAEINGLWLQTDENLLYDIELQVQERRVLLTGSVEDPELRLKAVRLCWQVDGVEEVINEIEISDKSGFTNYTRDAQISTELRSTMLVDQDIRSINYSIETVNQTIFLMGVARSQDELDRVIDHARNIEYVRRVRNYVRVKEPDPEPEDET
ncbi:MAG: BON domain-containing protein [Kiloniellales bacterium]|nr:BON domain-containing protein [Kiloniellales bacterium]MDJ0971635.1 BON domain-containing protein [Kiloniellales bacterium]